MRARDARALRATGDCACSRRRTSALTPAESMNSMPSRSSTISCVSAGRLASTRAPTTPAEKTSSTPETDAARTPNRSTTTTSAEGCVTRPFYLAFAASETLASDARSVAVEPHGTGDHGAAGARRRSVYGRIPPARNTSRSNGVSIRAIVSNSMPSADDTDPARQRAVLGEGTDAGEREDLVARESERRHGLAGGELQRQARPSRRGSTDGCARTTRR